MTKVFQKNMNQKKKAVKTLISVSRLTVAICLFIGISVINLINHPNLSPLIPEWPDGSPGQNVPESLPPSGLARQWHKTLANNLDRSCLH